MTRTYRRRKHRDACPLPVYRGICKECGGITLSPYAGYDAPNYHTSCLIKLGIKSASPPPLEWFDIFGEPPKEA